MDEDLDALAREALIVEVKRLRAGIREHRDSSGHELCWHHPQGLLPGAVPRDIAVPPWPKFMRGCVAYRTALERELTSNAMRGRIRRKRIGANPAVEERNE